jgi:hypothetical protein
MRRALDSEHWISQGRDVLSIRDAVFTVSPISVYLNPCRSAQQDQLSSTASASNLTPRTWEPSTLADTDPQWIPIRILPPHNFGPK